MTQYTIRNRKTDETWTVEADSYMAAAAEGAKVCNPTWKKLGVIRQTGERDKSGIFQATIFLGEDRIESTVGPQFSVV